MISEYHVYYGTGGPMSAVRIVALNEWGAIEQFRVLYPHIANQVGLRLFARSVAQC